MTEKRILYCNQSKTDIFRNEKLTSFFPCLPIKNPEHIQNLYQLILCPKTKFWILKYINIFWKITIVTTIKEDQSEKARFPFVIFSVTLGRWKRQFTTSIRWNFVLNLEMVITPPQNVLETSTTFLNHERVHEREKTCSQYPYYSKSWMKRTLNPAVWLQHKPIPLQFSGILTLLC